MRKLCPFSFAFSVTGTRTHWCSTYYRSNTHFFHPVRCVQSTYMKLCFVYTHYIYPYTHRTNESLYTFVCVSWMYNVYIGRRIPFCPTLPSQYTLTLRIHKNILMRRAIEFLDSLMYIMWCVHIYPSNQPPLHSASAAHYTTWSVPFITMRRAHHLFVLSLFHICVYR